MLTLFTRSAPRLRPCLSIATRGYKTTVDETSPLKTKLPVYRPDAEAAETVSIGKLREDQYSAAILKLDFVKIDTLISMSPEQLQQVVVIPKGDNAERALTDAQRIERLEAEVDRLSKLLGQKK